MKNRIIILVAIILSFNFNIKAQEEGKVIDKVIAVVGDNIILKSDLESQIVSIRAQGVLVDDNTRLREIAKEVNSGSDRSISRPQHNEKKSNYGPGPGNYQDNDKPGTGDT